MSPIRCFGQDVRSCSVGYFIGDLKVVNFVVSDGPALVITDE